MHHETESGSPLAGRKGEVTIVPFSADLSCCAKLAYVASVGCGPQMAFFIHGTPGTAADWNLVIGSLAEQGIECSTLSLDRPGFGENSDVPNARSFEEQIEQFVDLLESHRDPARDLVLVGHSYGAALAVGLAAKLSAAHVVSGLVLVAGVLSPLLRQRRWYHRVLTWPLVSAVAPKRYVRSAHEMSEVDSHLRRFSLAWQQFDFPVTLIHGDQDGLIPKGNSEFALDSLDQRLVRYLTIPGGGHGLLTSHPDLIAYEIGRLCKAISRKRNQHEL